jgi:hypothetical protein
VTNITVIHVQVLCNLLKEFTKAMKYFTSQIVLESEKIDSSCHYSTSVPVAPIWPLQVMLAKYPVSRRIGTMMSSRCKLSANHNLEPTGSRYYTIVTFLTF